MGDRLRPLWNFGDLDLTEHASTHSWSRSSRRAAARIHLERGRLCRSTGDPANALPLFESAFSLAQEARVEFLAADAAHMAALATVDRHGKLDWTQRGIDIAEGSADRDVAYWLGPLLNNLGCEYADAGEHKAALALGPTVEPSPT